MSFDGVKNELGIGNDAAKHRGTPSRSSSPESLHESCRAPPPAVVVAKFFDSVNADVYQKPKENKEKTQPWKSLDIAPPRPSADGRLVIAVPKICTYGSNNLGGL
ncbi:hypothetical protein BP6252_12865 [Coleophoma cylindrospora]|uniref:Uncharacterized protein n=1 Tax=Coleophoma cylindrospora TaxID=1849047 RepID=A0A3D8QDS9_9HELO|nr:hypothetical protein BP6252_12865 [Coleophoma cylindrospora]